MRKFENIFKRLLTIKALSALIDPVTEKEIISGINKAGAMRTASPCFNVTLTNMNTTKAIKCATLNPYRQAAAVQLAHLVRGGATIDAATINIVASQHMKNSTPGPMVVETIKQECSRILAEYKGKALPPVPSVTHPEWDADAVLPLPKLGKDKAANKAKAKRRLNK